MTNWTAALTVLAPLLGIIAKTFMEGSTGVRRRLKMNLDLRERLTEQQQSVLDELIEKELDTLVKKGDRRLRRRLDSGSLAAIIFVTLATGGVAWLLWQPDHWAWHVAAILVSVFGALVIAVGLPQLFKYDETDTGKRDS